MRAVAALCLLVLPSVLAWQKPAFCRDRDCPEFTVVSRGNGYELRNYKQSKWACTQFTGTWSRSNFRVPFRRLLAYIKGANSRGLTIPMTVPVAIRAPAGTGSRTFFMCFYVPPNLHSNTPAPTDRNVIVRTVPEGRQYVRTYSSGNPSEQSVNTAISELKAAIGNPALYKSDHFYASSYNKPSQRTNRHYEVSLSAA